MKVIYKYPIGFNTTLEIPASSKVVHFGFQPGHESPFIWVEHDSDKDINKVKRTFVVHGTGEWYEPEMEYVMTTLDGPLVYHLMEYKTMTWQANSYASIVIEDTREARTGCSEGRSVQKGAGGQDRRFLSLKSGGATMPPVTCAVATVPLKMRAGTMSSLDTMEGRPHGTISGSHIVTATPVEVIDLSLSTSHGGRSRWMKGTRMMIEDMLDGVERIRKSTEDPEGAHSAEDSLRYDALMAIYGGNLTKEEMMEVARIALSTEDFEFPRWCA
jgi:hypothetical protein